jgi:acetyl-CoA synthetase
VSDIAWRPDTATIEHANATRLMRRAGVGEYRELVRRSADDPAWFWPLVVADMGIEFSQPWTEVYDDSRGPAWTTWFNGGRVSIAHNCAHRWGTRTPNAIAAIGLGEEGSRRELTFGELSRDVTRLAERLAGLGVREGDRVAIFLPMTPDVAVASHAVAHLGAIQVPIFSGFAAPAVAQRLQASEAKVVITQTTSSRRGRAVPMLEIVEEAIRQAPVVEHVVLAPFELDDCPAELPALEVDSETPYLLTYTSGTTGTPKGVVHVQGGFLVSIAREVCYQADVHEGDVMHFATDMGWIMGPWTLVGVGALGGTIVFAEGAPDWPTPDRLWRIVEQERVTSL